MKSAGIALLLLGFLWILRDTAAFTAEQHSLWIWHMQQLPEGNTITREQTSKSLRDLGLSLNERHRQIIFPASVMLVGGLLIAFASDRKKRETPQTTPPPKPKRQSIFPVTPLVLDIKSRILQTFDVSDEVAESYAGELVALAEDNGGPETAQKLDWDYRIRKDLGEKFTWKSERDREAFLQAENEKHKALNLLIQHPPEPPRLR